MTQKILAACFQTRRRSLGVAAATLAGVGLPVCGGGGDGSPVGGSGGASSVGNAPAPVQLVPPVLPVPTQSGVDHVVPVVMENRSFDRYPGWLPSANGKQAGLQFIDAFGNSQNSFRLTTDPKYSFQGCGFADPDHSYEGARTQLNSGKMDGWLFTTDTNKTPGDLFPIGYYQAEDLPFLGSAVRDWTVYDSYHCGVLAKTYPSRFYSMCGETDRLHNFNAIRSLLTIFDRFAEKGVSANYYFSDVSFTALSDAGYLKNSRPLTMFLTDAIVGTLPVFSYVNPRFTGENPQGVSADDHPNPDIRNGQIFLNQIYDAVRNGSGWQKMLPIITYDERSGFLDHAPPFRRPVSAVETQLGNDDYLGLRVPMVLIGPQVKCRHVSHWPFDPSSIHQLLTWRFGLSALGARDGLPDINSIAYALDFVTQPNLSVPAYSVPQGLFGGVCPGSIIGSVPGISGVSGISSFRTIVISLGFPLP